MAALARNLGIVGALKGQVTALGASSQSSGNETELTYLSDGYTSLISSMTGELGEGERKQASVVKQVKRNAGGDITVTYSTNGERVCLCWHVCVLCVCESSWGTWLSVCLGSLWCQLQQPFAFPVRLGNCVVLLLIMVFLVPLVYVFLKS